MLQIRMTVLCSTVVIALYGVLASTNLLRFVRVGESAAGYSHVFRGVVFFFLWLLCWLWSRKSFVSRGRRSVMLILWGGLGGALCGDLSYLVMLLWEHFRNGRFHLPDFFDAPLWVIIPIVSGTWILGILCLAWLDGIRACVPSRALTASPQAAVSAK
jgi:hypothetical protein